MLIEKYLVTESTYNVLEGGESVERVDVRREELPAGTAMWTREQVRKLYDDFGFPPMQREHFLDEIFGKQEGGG